MTIEILPPSPSGELTHTDVRNKINEVIENTGGFIDYNDTSTSTTPLTLLADTWTTLPNDGLGAFTNKAYAPSGITELMDTTTGELDFTEVDLGVSLLIRNDYEVTPNVNNAQLQIRYSLGGGGNEYTLPTIVGRLDSGSGTGYRITLKPDYIYIGDTNTKNNPGAIQIKLSAAGSVVNYGSVIGAIKQ
tara:strand:+ start:235 stop:801 length:567 start_codon:yes stop_codon:yes gene_type:complete